MTKTTVLLLGVLIAGIAIFSCQTEPFLPDLTTLDPNEPCPPGAIHFKREIQPIISANCAFSGCHDAISAEDGVVLDTYENIMREVTPFDPNESELYESLMESGDDVMPPRPYDLLSTAQIKLIKDWINQGALDIDCGGCDTDNVSFSGHVYPILQTQCTVCHNDNRQDGGVNLDSYDLIKANGANGKLMGTIEHQSGFSVMPPSGVKIDQCFIDQLNAWIAAGMPNN
jgi:hypothetical protein